MIHHRRHSLITKRGKKKPEEEKKVAKTRVVWRKKKKLVSAIRQKSNATRRVVNTGPPLFNFNELAKIQDGPLSSAPPRFDVIMSRREGGAGLYDCKYD